MCLAEIEERNHCKLSTAYSTDFLEQDCNRYTEALSKQNVRKGIVVLEGCIQFVTVTIEMLLAFLFYNDALLIIILSVVII